MIILLQLHFLITLFVTVMTVLLGFLVFRNNTKSSTNRIYSILSGVTILWLIFVYLSSSPIFHSYYLELSRLTIFFAPAQALAFFLLAHTLPRSKIQIKKNIFILLLMLAAVVMTLTLTPLIFSDFKSINEKDQIIIGPAMPVFVAFVSICSLAAIATLIKKIYRSKGIERKQLVFILMGILLMLGLIILTIMVPIIFFKNDSFLPFAPIYVFLFLAMTAYSIIRYKFMSIRLILARSFVYILMIFFVSAIGSTIIISLGQYLTNVYGINQFITIVIASILIVTFLEPLKKFFSRLTEKLFYKSKIDYEAVLKFLSEIINEEVELSLLVERYTRTIVKKIKISNAVLWLPVGDKIFIPSNEYQRDKKSSKRKYKITPNLINILSLKKNPLLLDEYKFLLNDKNDEGEKNEIIKIIDTFEKIDSSLLLPIFNKNNLTAILALGNKLSGELYSKEDSDFLEVIAPQLGAALEKARLYQEAKEFNIKLQREIEKATTDLKAANTKLKDLDQAKSEFMSIASHQLRTPLAGILGYLSMIKDGDYGKTNPEQEPVIKDVLDATQRLIRMVNIFLNVTRIEAGRFVMNYTTVPFADVIEAMYKELKPTADKKKVTLIYEKKPLPEVEVDADKIKDVLLNLIDNAIKYSPSGTVTISAEAADKTVHFMVKDTGVGIAKGEAVNLFNKFVRGSEIARVEPNGSGLGLFIAKKITEGHGGRIWAESEGEGKGTTFNVEIPITADASAKSKTEAFKAQATK